MAAHSPAHATASASGTLRGFSVQLIDLDSADGIVPSILWSNGATGAVVGGHLDFSFDPALRREYSNSSIVPVLLLSGGDISPAAMLASSVAKGNSDPGAGLALSASNQTFGVLAGTTGFVNSNAFATSDLTFTLTGNTIAIFRALATGSAMVDQGGVGNQVESINGAVYLRVFGPSSSAGDGFQSSEDGMAFAASSIAAPASKTATLSGTFANVTGFAKVGFLGTEVSIGALSNVAAVPEPESWAMLLLGMGLVGSMMRRRRSLPE